MAAQQKRMLTAPTSKLGKADIWNVLRKEEAWTLLPQDTREALYTFLPGPWDGESAHDTDVHPLKTVYKPYIEEELRRWQDDLKDGREGKKWREEAMQAGRDRTDGKFDEWKEVQREEYWGKPVKADENVEVKDEVKGEGVHDEQQNGQEDQDGGKEVPDSNDSPGAEES